MNTEIACPACDYAFDLLTAFSDNEDQRTLELFVRACFPIGDRVMRYLTLFTPPQHRLTIRKQLRLIKQLTPDLDRQAITHRGRDWAAPQAAWARAIDNTLAARDAGGLDLPLKNHAYLYSILANMADRFETQAEKQRELDQRGAPRQATVQVHGQAMSIGDALQVVHAGQDPALIKLDADSRNASPMPDSVRERISQFKRGAP